MKKVVCCLIALLLTMSLVLTACASKVDEKPIEAEGESTIVETDKSVEKLAEEPNAVSYAFINTMKNKLDSYVTETTGTLTAKVAFFDYVVNFSSITIKKNNLYYSKDTSHSTFYNVDSDFFSNGEKIVYSKDLKNYKVATLDDYHKISYTLDQALVMGYVFSEKSILSSSLVSNDNGQYTFKYLLDNEASTPYVKGSMKETGDLVNYPSFATIEISLTMKNDFTPVKIVLDASYVATKAVIGAGNCSHHAEMTFSQVNQPVVIENEDFYLDLIGREAEKIDVNDDGDLKNELLRSLDKLPWPSGVEFVGNLNTQIMPVEDSDGIKIDLDVAMSVDPAKLKEDNIFNFARLYATAECDEHMSTLFNLVETFAADKLGDYSELLQNLKGATLYYVGDANLYLTVHNDKGEVYSETNFDLGTILVNVLSKVNLYDLLTRQQAPVEFVKEKGEGDVETINLVLEQETLDRFAQTIDGFFEEQTLLKLLINYEKFHGVEIAFTLSGGALQAVDARVTFDTPAETGDEQTAVTKTLVGLTLQVKELQTDINKEGELQAVLAEKQQADAVSQRVAALLDNFWAGESFNARVNALIADYDELSQQAKLLVTKRFAELDKVVEVSQSIVEIKRILDVNELSNAALLEAKRAYDRLDKEYVAAANEYLGDSKQMLINVQDYVDAESFVQAVGALEKDENGFPKASPSEWGWTEEQISSFKALCNLANISDAVAKKLEEAVGKEVFSAIRLQVLYVL